MFKIDIIWKLNKPIKVHVKRVYSKPNKINEGKNDMSSSLDYQGVTFSNPLIKNVLTARQKF